jgi:hypothetical protein
MGASEFPKQGWILIVLGLCLFAAGIGSLFDPASSRIYIGAIIVGPIMVVRGLLYLDRYYPERRSPFWAPHGQPATTAPELYKMDILAGSLPKEVTCESCSQQYVYFPERAAEAQAATLGPEIAQRKALIALMNDRALAPCPRCGWIQPDMLRLARGRAGPSITTYMGLFLILGSAIFRFVIMQEMAVPAMRQRQEASNQVPYFVASAVLFLVGLGLLIWGLVRQKSWDPNRQSVERRIRLAHQVSLTRDDYLRLAAAKAERFAQDPSQGSEPNPPGVSVTISTSVFDKK